MKLRRFDLNLEIPLIELKQLWHRRFQNDPGLVWLRRIVTELYLNSDPTEFAAGGIFDPRFPVAAALIGS